MPELCRAIFQSLHAGGHDEDQSPTQFVGCDERTLNPGGGRVILESVLLFHVRRTHAGN
jgi:hypothetical protein